MPNVGFREVNGILRGPGGIFEAIRIAHGAMGWVELEIERPQWDIAKIGSCVGKIFPAGICSGSRSMGISTTLSGKRDLAVVRSAFRKNRACVDRNRDPYGTVANAKGLVDRKRFCLHGYGLSIVHTPAGGR